jgi:hypothetical protein
LHCVHMFAWRCIKAHVPAYHFMDLLHGYRKQGSNRAISMCQWYQDTD